MVFLRMLLSSLLHFVGYHYNFPRMFRDTAQVCVSVPPIIPLYVPWYGLGIINIIITNPSDAPEETAHA